MGWRLWVAWVVASAVGFALAGAGLHFPGSFPVGSGVNATFDGGAAVVGAVLGAVSGLAVGALQWLVLRGRVARAALWIPATALGVAFTHALGDGLPAVVDYGPIGVVGGAVMGAAQFAVLGSRSRRAATRWVLASAVGLAAGIAFGLVAAEATGVMRQTWTPAVGAQQHALVSGITGLVWGAVTGAALVRHLQAAAREAPTAARA